MTIIAFGNINDCNFIITDTYSFPKNAEGQVIDIIDIARKISEVKINEFYAACSGYGYALTIFERYFRNQDYKINLVNTIERDNFIAYLNIDETPIEVTQSNKQDTTLFICYDNDLFRWRIRYNHDTFEEEHFEKINDNEVFMSYFGEITRYVNIASLNRNNILTEMRNWMSGFHNHARLIAKSVNPEPNPHRNFVLLDIGYVVKNKPDGDFVFNPLQIQR